MCCTIRKHIHIILFPYVWKQSWSTLINLLGKFVSNILPTYLQRLASQGYGVEMNQLMFAKYNECIKNPWQSQQREWLNRELSNWICVESLLLRGRVRHIHKAMQGSLHCSCLDWEFMAHFISRCVIQASFTTIKTQGGIIAILYW